MQLHATGNCGREGAGEAWKTWLLRLHATGIYSTAAVGGAVRGEAVPNGAIVSYTNFEIIIRR